MYNANEGATRRSTRNEAGTHGILTSSLNHLEQRAGVRLPKHSLSHVGDCLFSSSGSRRRHQHLASDLKSDRKGKKKQKPNEK